MSGTLDQRRGTRVSARLRVRVLGLDEDEGLRTGDISVSGVFFSSSVDLGAVGSVERLELASEDGMHKVVTPAVLVRVATVSDFWLGQRTIGAAWQYRPEDDATRASLAALVDHLSELPEAADEPLPPPSADADARSDRWRAAPSSAEGSGPLAPAPRASQTVVVISPWTVEEGTPFELSFKRDGEARTLKGRVSGHRPLGSTGRYRLDLKIEKAPEDVPAPSGALEDAVASLLDAMDVSEGRLPPHAPGENRDHVMVGSLARVPLPSLLGFLEWESWSGALEIEKGEERAILHLRRGVLVDAEGPRSDPKDVVRHLIGWKDGLFRLTDDDSEREDRLQMPMRHLIMDLAREADEATPH